MIKTKIRLAKTADLPAIDDIYNHYVATSTTTYCDEPKTLDSRRKWLTDREEKHPVTVAVSGGEVMAWGSLAQFRPNCGYRYTVESSVYVDADHHRQGIGSMIVADQLQRARQLGMHTVIAVIDSDQSASMELHRKFGFEEVGRLREVGRKLDRWLDAVLMEVVLAE